MSIKAFVAIFFLHCLPLTWRYTTSCYAYFHFKSWLFH